MTKLPETIRCPDQDAFRSFLASSANNAGTISAVEAELAIDGPFTVPGTCAVCDRTVDFQVDYTYSWVAPDGRRWPNWREHLACPHCRLNNRLRAAAGFLLAAAGPDDTIYLTEAASPLFQVIAGHRQHTIGSEFLPDGTASGQTNAVGIRHEDVTRLTLPDNAVDVIGSFDVLEHVPDYRRGLSEFLRCLKPGGRLFLTVPLDLAAAATVTRARLAADGQIEHLLPPEIHGDPLSPDGVLCFYNFGWDFIDELTAQGFADAGLSLFWDRPLGYLGGYQFIISARKPATGNGKAGLFHRVAHLIRQVTHPSP
jgi:SAM-dependent methyltransferase